MATLPKEAQELSDHLVPEGLTQHPDKARELNAVYCFKVTGDASGQGGDAVTRRVRSSYAQCRAGTSTSATTPHRCSP
jgi:hypothetical protein